MILPECVVKVQSPMRALRLEPRAQSIGQRLAHGSALFHTLA